MANNLGWFKFWTKALHNPKIVALDNAQFRLLVTLWSLASESSERGTIYAPNWNIILQISGANEWGETVDVHHARVTLVKLGLVTEREDGTIEVCDWDEWQSSSDTTTAQRSRRYRKGLKERVVTRDATVTPHRDDTTRSRSRSRKEVEEKDQEHGELATPTSPGSPVSGSNGNTQNPKSVSAEDLDPDRWSHVMAALDAAPHLRDRPRLRNLLWWDALAKAHPSDDLDAEREIAKMEEYLLRTGRKYKDWQRFVSNWLNNAEERS